MSGSRDYERLAFLYAPDATLILAAQNGFTITTLTLLASQHR